MWLFLVTCINLGIVQLELCQDTLMKSSIIFINTEHILTWFVDRWNKVLDNTAKPYNMRNVFFSILLLRGLFLTKDAILLREFIMLASTSKYLFKPKMEIGWVKSFQRLGSADWLIKYKIDDVSSPCVWCMFKSTLLMSELRTINLGFISFYFIFLLFSFILFSFILYRKMTKKTKVWYCHMTQSQIRWQREEYRKFQNKIMSSNMVTVY